MMCKYVHVKCKSYKQNLHSQAVLDVLNFVMNEQAQPGVEPPTKYMQHDHGKYFTFFRHTLASLRVTGQRNTEQRYTGLH